MAPLAAIGAQPATIAWAVSRGGANSDMGFAVASDPDGNAVLAGRVASAVPSAGDLDASITKFNRDGQLIWVLQPGGSGRDTAQDVAIDAEGNTLVTGFFRDTGDFGGASAKSAGHRDVFIAKYDPDGAVLWLRRAGGPRIDEGRGVATDSDGNVVVTGGFEGQASFAEDVSVTAEKGGQAFIAKYAPDGTTLWARQAGGAKETWGNSIATDTDGNVLVGGAFAGNASFDNTKLKSRGDLDIFIAKYDPDGTLIWAQSAGGSGRDIAYSVTTDYANNVLVAGGFNRTASFNDTRLKPIGDRDAFVAKYAPDGTLVWAISFGSRGNDSARGIASDSNGNVLLTGSFRNTMKIGETVLASAGRSDMFAIVFDPEGALLSAHTAGGRGADRGYGIATDGRGGAYVTGSFAATATFGDTQLPSAGTDDQFIAKLNY